MHGQDPHTICLPVHTENHHLVTFAENERLESVISKNTETQLTHFLKLNQIDNEVRHLYYYQMPIHYIWNNAKKNWTKRKM